MARRNRNKRPYAPGAGQDAGRQRRQRPETEGYVVRGRDTGNGLHKKGQGKGKQRTAKVQAPTPKPQPRNEAVAFTRAAARRAVLSPPPTQRERLVSLGLVCPAKKEVTNV